MAEQGELIRLEGVGKIFPSPSGPVRVLDDVSLRVERGSIFGLIGRSGAGKSTLLRLVNRLETPTSGRVFVGGQDVAALSPAELLALRRRVGMVFQHFNLMSAKTVAQNVALWSCPDFTGHSGGCDLIRNEFAGRAHLQP